MYTFLINKLPNILYIHSHDTGRYVQPYGFPVPTPNIQLLADQGVLFRNAFCAAPTCSGSRASLLTGQYCHNNGLLGLAHRGWELNDYGQHWVHPLREAGYRSVLIGEQLRGPGGDRLRRGDRGRQPPRRRHRPDRDRAPRRDAGALLHVGRLLRDPPHLPRPHLCPRHPLLAAAGEPAGHAETRADMAAFKASARSLDQGIGAVLNGLHQCGLQDNTLIICTTDHGLAFPNAKATLYDRGIGVMLIMRGPGGFLGGRVFDGLVSHLDIYPTLCELAGIEQPPFLQGTSLLPLVRGETAAINDAVFAEMTYHAAYQPLRAVRTERFKYIRRFDDYDRPVLAICDDSASKKILMDAGWGDQHVPEEQLYDLLHDPNEANDLSGDPTRQDTLVELRERLLEWMRATEDPLLTGPVPEPPGTWSNDPRQASPNDPTSAAER